MAKKKAKAQANENALLFLLEDCKTEEELRHICTRIEPQLADHGERAQLVKSFEMARRRLSEKREEENDTEEQVETATQRRRRWKRENDKRNRLARQCTDMRRAI